MIAGLDWLGLGSDWWGDISRRSWDGCALGADGGSASDELGRGRNSGLGGGGTILNTGGSDWADGGRDINKDSGVVNNDLGGAWRRWSWGADDRDDGRSNDGLGADDGASSWARNNLWPAGSDSVGSCLSNNVGGERRNWRLSGDRWWWGDVGAVLWEWRKLDAGACGWDGIG